ncbi:hypothetical protein C0J52_17334 [Blattella germanica]|nr:hypothetical protein C0J52_17334 [Blattella germanica]
MSTSDERSDSTSTSLCEDCSTMGGSSRRSSFPECDINEEGSKRYYHENDSRRTSEPTFCVQSSFQERLQCCKFRCNWIITKIHDNPLCPSWGRLSRILALVALGLMLWGYTYSLLDKIAGIDGQLFRIGVLCVAAHLAGWLIHLIGLPPLLGMLLMGILLRNVGFVELTGKWLSLAGNLRKVALVVILIRAGLGLDPSALKRLSWVVLRLSIFPSVVEVLFVAIMMHFLLDFPWLWGLLMGTVLAAVSPAVVIPCSVHLQDKGYGRKKGIPTLIIAAASVDDINAISAFGVLLGIIFSTGNQTMQLLQGPLGLVIGLISGSIMGFFLQYVPQKNDEYVVTLRTLLLACGSLLLMFGIDALGYKGAGPLGCMVAGFVACHGWRAQGWNEGKIYDIYSVIKPMLYISKLLGMAPFSLKDEIGSRNLEVSNPATVYSILILLILFIRQYWIFNNLYFEVVDSVFKTVAKIETLTISLTTLGSIIILLYKRHYICIIFQHISQFDSRLCTLTKFNESALLLLIGQICFHSVISTALCLSVTIHIGFLNFIKFINSSPLSNMLIILVIDIQVTNLLTLIWQRFKAINQQFENEINNGIFFINQESSNKINTSFIISNVENKWFKNSFIKFKELKDHHYNLCSICGTVNNTYGILMLMNVLFKFVDIVFNAYFRILRVLKYSKGQYDHDIWEWTMTALMCWYIVKLAITLWSYSSVTYQVRYSILE